MRKQQWGVTAMKGMGRGGRERTWGKRGRNIAKGRTKGSNEGNARDREVVQTISKEKAEKEQRRKKNAKVEKSRRKKNARKEQTEK